MKKFFTLCLGLIAALTIQAQDSFPLQFADSNGNIIPDGTVLNLTEYSVDDIDDVVLPSNLYVKNTTDSEIHCKGIYTVKSISNGGFQTCFPDNCLQPNTEPGEFETKDGTIRAGQLKSMQTEWFPEAEGTCVVEYQLLTMKQNPITTVWSNDEEGPRITLNFIYNTSAVSNAKADKKVSSVEYYDMQGRHISKPASGLFVKKTLFADGTDTKQKMMKH